MVGYRMSDHWTGAEHKTDRARPRAVFSSKHYQDYQVAPAWPTPSAPPGSNSSFPPRSGPDSNAQVQVDTLHASLFTPSTTHEGSDIATLRTCEFSPRMSLSMTMARSSVVKFLSVVVRRSSRSPGLRSDNVEGDRAQVLRLLAHFQRPYDSRKLGPSHRTSKGTASLSC